LQERWIGVLRDQSLEAAAGKNPVSHVGKIYTLLTHKMAAEVYVNVPGLHEVYVWLCSQIGRPIDQPMIASVQLILKDNIALADIQPAAESVVASELEKMRDFTGCLIQGEWTVC
jgi:S-adenosylmethionine synthetase